MAEVWFDARAVEAWLSGRPVIANLSLQLRLGESTAVLGPNGAGKSTLLKLIDRSLHPIVKPQSHLKLFGAHRINVQNLRRRIGLVTTDLESRFPGLITAHSVVLSGLFGAMRLGHGQSPSSEQIAQTDAVLKQLDLSAIASQPFGQLSDGQRRRLMLARALVHQPEVLILDEPSRALDLKACHQLLDNLRQLCNNGTTLIHVTHRIDTIVPEMQRVLFMRRGQLCGDGPPKQQLRDQPLSDLFDTPLRVLEHNGFHQVLPG